VTIEKKDGEATIWSWGKAAGVFGANHKDCWTAANYQNLQLCCGPIVKIRNFTLSKPWWSLGSRAPKGLIKIFVRSIKTAEKKNE